MPTTQFNWSHVDLPDPSTYYGGFKEARLLRAGPFIRALSDRRGEYESATFEIEISDHDRLMRGKLAGATAQYIINKTMIVRTTSDTTRRALGTARTVGIGLIRDYKPEADFKFRFRCEDYLALFTGLGRDERQIPKRTLSRDDFPDLDQTMIGKPVPICYGDLTSQASATPPPTIDLQWADGGFWNPNVEGTGRGVWHAGWGTVSPASTAAVPTGVSVTDSAGGSIGLGWNELNLFNVAVTSVDADGNESDPEYFNWHEPIYPYAVTLASDGRKIDVSWAAAAGAVGYRVYIGHANVDEAICRIETFGTSVSFDKLPKKGEQPTADNIATGSELIEFAESWLYAVTAMMPDGETNLSQLVYGKSQGYRRPLKIQWGTVTGAIEYRVYRRTVQVKGINDATEDSIWDRRWTVSAGTLEFDDDLLDTGVTYVDSGPVNGKVPLVYVGKATSLVDGSSWHRYLVCGHAIKSIKAVFIDNEQVDEAHFGATAAIPGKTGYTSFWPNTGADCQYTDINGRRYTFCYGRGPVSQEVAEGKKKAAVNIEGIEDTGDSTGDLITDIFDQMKHFWRNFGAGEYDSGAWPSAGPLWPDVTPPLDVIDDASFDACKAIGLKRLPDTGYVGSAMIGGEGARHTMREIVRRWNQSGDCFLGFNSRSQLMVTMIDDTSSLLATASEFTEARDITESSFDITDVVQELENVVPYIYNRIYSTSQWAVGEGEERDATSITNYGEEKRGELLELYFVHNGNVAADIAARRLLRHKVPPRVVRFKTNLIGMNEDLGSYIKVTHSEGIGSAGWVRQPLFVIRHAFEAEVLGVELTALDIGRITGYVDDGGIGGLGGGGAFILGDETVLPAAWTSASLTQRGYGYLCDEATGLFSDGAAGKALR